MEIVVAEKDEAGGAGVLLHGEVQVRLLCRAAGDKQAEEGSESQRAERLFFARQRRREEGSGSRGPSA